MTNDNNNINELVADDDDPTVELDVLPGAQDQSSTLESEATTYDRKQATDEFPVADIDVSELQTDLRSRKKTIGQLHYDMQQLHSKWLGLEAEIGEREAQTGKLNSELSSARKTIVRKEKLLKKRDQKIKSLKTEIRQRDENHRQLKVHLDELRLVATETSAQTDDAHPDEVPRPDLQLRLERTEEYADALRQQLQDMLEANARAERESDSLSRRLDDVEHENSRLSEALALSTATVEKLESTLGDIQKLHDDEIRLLRFELGAAENTIVETEDLNQQLASDLVDAHGFKDELEQMLGSVEEQSSERIAALQKEVTKLQRSIDSYEQKLTTKSEAISVLIAELAKKPAQIDSIGEIEDVILDIDERMSERSGNAEKRMQTDRMTRVLIGTVDDQVLQFPLFKDRLTIGRTKDNDIQLKAGYVSRRHAVIQTDGDSTRIIDWGSKNGIHVNSEKISEHFLRHGDTITIGNARFRYEERKKRDV